MRTTATQYLVIAAALLSTAAHAGAPTPPQLDDKEEARLDKGKIVVRHEDTPTGGRVTAIATVQAPPRKVLDEVMNLEARVPESSVLTSVEVYERTAAPDVTAATFTITVLGSDTVFSIRYDCQRDQGFCTYALDPSKENDIVSSDGYYLVVPEGTGTRLVYASRADTGRSMPGWMRRWIAGSSLEGQVDGIRKRAEGR